MFQYETSIESRKPPQTPNHRRYSIKSNPRNPSIKTIKTKISEYTIPHKKSNIINIYPNNISNISFDYSNNNEYNLLNYKNKNIDNIIKEKNALINNLQNQISTYILKSKESSKKINLQEQIISSLKEQIKQLNNDIVRKKNIIEQNEDFDYKISKLKKDVEKSRDKKLNDDFNESKRHNFILNNKINNLKQEIKDKNEIINKLKIKNENFFKKLKDNELLLKNKNSIIEQLNEENIMIKNRFEELEKSFEKLSQQINVLNIPNKENNILKKENINANINKNIYENENKKTGMDMGMNIDTDELKIMEMKVKNCENELNEKNIMLNLINNKNNLLNNLLVQRNKVIKTLQDEKINNKKKYRYINI